MQKMCGAVLLLPRTPFTVVATRLRSLVVVCLLAWSASCATPATTEQHAVIIEDIPFFSQEAYQCGPAALATVIGYWQNKAGRDTSITPEGVAADIYSPSAKGVLPLDLEFYARKQGFQTRQYSGDLDDLKRNVDRGVPTIIFVDYGLSLYQANHFMVVTGYTKDGVIVNSGRRENQPLSRGELEKIWKKNRYWSLALRPSP